MHSGHAEGAFDAPRAFACFVPARPPAIWQALTQPDLTSNYLYGLALHSDWVGGAHIRACNSAGARLSGQVLCTLPEQRLSYLLHSEDNDPPVYLTWLIRGCGDGCILTLQIDEVEGADCRDETEDTWLPVLAALQRCLAEQQIT